MDELEIDDQGHGFDAFGASREGIAFAIAFTRFLYEVYFRVKSHGIERVPAQGPVLLAVNHSGLIPLDAMMVAADLIRHCPGGRAPNRSSRGAASTSDRLAFRWPCRFASGRRWSEDRRRGNTR